MPTLGTAIVDDATLELDNAGAILVQQTIAGSGVLLQAGAGTSTLAAHESFSGTLLVQSGTVALGAGATFSSPPTLEVNNGVFELGGANLTVGLLAGSGGTIFMDGGTLRADAIDAAFNDSILGPGVFAVGDNATLNNRQTIAGISFGNNDTFTNAHGTIANGAVSGAGAVQGGITAGANLSLENGNTIAGAVSLSNGVLNNDQGSTTNSGSGANGSTAGIIGGSIAATGSLSLANGGTVAGGVSLQSGTIANMHGIASALVGGTLTASAGVVAGNIIAGAGLYLANGGTITGYVVLASGTIINEAGRVVSPQVRETATTEGYIGGSVGASLGLDLTNQGIIAGRVSMLSGTVSNVGGYFYDRDNLPGFIYSATAGVLEDGVSAVGALTITNQSTLLGGVTAGSATVFNIDENFLGVEQPLLSGGVTVAAGLTLQNQGTIAGGITAGGNGTVTNAALSGVGQVATISGGIVLQGAASTFTNNGVVLDGLTLSSGGTVSNLVNGVLASVTVDGAGQIYNANTIGAVWVGNGATLDNGVYNFGTINAVTIAAGGALTNHVAQGAINSLYVFGSVNNTGIIRNLISVAPGGVFYNQGFSADPSYIIDSGTVVNAGGLRHGISIGSGGTLINRGGAHLYSVTDAGSVINYGALENGADVQAGGVLINRVAYGPTSGVIADNGSVANYGVLNGIQVGGGGTLTNEAGGKVPLASSSNGTVVNSGYFYRLSVGGGSVTNQANGTLGSVILTSPNATLVEAGTIESGIFIAGFSTGIEIDGGGVLQILPGAVVQEPPGDHAVYLQSGTVTLASGTTLPDIDAKENTGIAVPNGTATVGGVHGVSVVTLGAGAVLSTADFSYSFGGSSVAFRGAGTLTGGQILASNVYNAVTIDNAVTPDRGLVNGTLTNATAGVINGVVDVGQLTNYGYIASATAGGVNEANGTIGALSGGGDLTNIGLVLHGVGGGFATFTNIGTVLAGFNNYTEVLDNQGSIGGGIAGDGTQIDNEAGAIISGNVQMKGFVGDQTLTNAGTIIGNVVSIGEAIGYSPATVDNTGTIEGSVQGVEILTNAAGGAITGGISDGAIQGYTATNAGFIGGTSTLNGADLLVNQTGGTLGTVLLAGAYATLVQAGTILGGVTLSGNKDQVVLSPTAVTYGALRGSNNDSATLELQAGTGTLTSVSNFGTVIFDSGANWVIGAGVTFTAHPTLGVPGTLIGATSLEIAGLLANYQTLTQAITVQSGATLANGASGRLLGSIDDAGLVTNAGYISALNLTGSGVTNLSTGTIAGALIEADANDSVSNAGKLLQGVTLTGPNAVLSNTGTILGGVTASGSGETVSNGGSIAGAVSIAGSNGVLVLSPGAHLGAGATGNSSATLAFAAGNGTVSGLGSTISGFGTYIAQTGAVWSLAGSTDVTGTFALGGAGTLSITGSLDNSGTLSGNIEVGAGGTLFNHTGGQIRNGLTDAGLLIDAGAISGPVTVAGGGTFSLSPNGEVSAITGAGAGIDIALAGTVTNGVTLQGSGNTLALTAFYAVGSSTLAASTTIELTAGGGTLAGGVSLLGHGVQLDGGAGWQDNESGSTAGGMTIGGSGVLTLTGDVTLGGGISVGAGVALDVLGAATSMFAAAPGAATIVDDGTIVGGVSLAGGGDVLALAPTAAIDGAISAGAGAVLELEAGAGTLHSLYGFTTIAADAGANWTLVNIPALSTGLTLTGAGTINSGALTGTGSLNNSATLNASVNVGAVENYGVILGTIASAGPVDNRGSIGASVTLTGNGGLYNHVSAPIGGSVYATGNNETIVNWGDINGQVVLSGHDDGVELIGAGTYAGGVFTGGVTGAADGSSAFYLPATNLELSSLTLANFANYTNVPNLSIAAGITLTIQSLDRSETFQGAGTLSVPNLVGGTLTNAGYMQSGIVLSNTARLINLPGATLAGYTSSGPYGGPAVNNFTTGAQTITNLGTMGGVSLSYGGVLELGSTGTFTQNVYGYHAGLDSSEGGAYGSTLRLLSGTGGISGFGDHQFNSTQYFPIYSFNNFNTIDVASGGTWSLAGDPKIANALLVSGAGTLNLPQGLTVEHGFYRNYSNLLDFEPQYYERGYFTVSGRVTNSGVLQGNVVLSGTGGFINLAGGALNGGIDVTGTGQTVGNLGAMAGGVALYGGDRLIEGAGATFGGAISGGAGGNVLEIASGPFALTNFNAPGYAQFTTLQIDAGVSVTQDASDTLAGVALINYGAIDLSAGFIAQAPLTNGGMLTGDVTLASGVPVTNVAGGTISGDGLAAIEGQGGPARVFNSGLIDPATYGAYLPAGGYVTNASGGTIIGTVAGVKISGAAGTVSNVGSIAGTGAGSTGVELISGGWVTNQSGGTIDGAEYGVQSSNAATVANAGRIGVGAVAGIGLASGLIANAATATIAGSSTGVRIFSGGTIIDAGTITGGGDAVHFYAGSVSRLVLYPDAVFSGLVDGGNAVGAATVSTLELASAASAGTLSGIGSRYVNFGSIAVDAGATWTLTGGNTLAAGGTIDNAGSLVLSGATLNDAGTLINDGGIVVDPSTMFAATLQGSGAITLAAGATLEVGGAIANTQTIVFQGDGATLRLQDPADAAGPLTDFTVQQTIDLAGVAPGSVHYDATSGGLLEFTYAAGGSGSILLPGGGPVTGAPDNAGGADVTALCFCKGTLIRTVRGDVPVEELAVGDLVRTWRGDKRPIAWIGVGKVLATRGQRSAATPVIVRRGALADNVPARDLRVTKGHAFLLDGVLIPVEFLVNHRSILWDDRAQEVALYHVELDAHDVMVANGAPAESYRDDGNRWLFRNANSGWDLPPKEPCAPVLTGGPIVDAAWARLRDRAGRHGTLPLTDDPDLHLLVDGQRVSATSQLGTKHIFVLPQAPRHVAVVSRAASPAELGIARDPRLLGVALRQVALWQGKSCRVIEACDSRLTSGFHGYEPECGLRWTNGMAELPAELFAGLEGVVELALHVGGATLYLAEAAVRAA